MQIAFQLTELFQIEIEAVIYTDQFICYVGTWTRRLKFVAILNAALCLIQIQSRYLMNCVVYMDLRPFQCAVFKWVKAFKAGKLSVEDDTSP